MKSGTHVLDELLAALTLDQSSGSPTEVVHGPERHEREEEGEDGDGKDVKDHPPDHIPLASEEEDERLETVDGSQHDDRESRDGLALRCDEHDEVDDL